MEIVDTLSPKRGNRGLIITLVILGIIIVGLIVGIIVVSLRNNEIAKKIEEENLPDVVADYLINGNTDIDIEDVKTRLKKIIRESDNKNQVIRAASDLAALYDSEEEKVAVIKGVLASDLSDQERYRLLSILLAIYKEFGDTEGSKDTLVKLLELPEDMVLKYEDWSMIRNMFEYELKTMEDNSNED